MVAGVLCAVVIEGTVGLVGATRTPSENIETTELGVLFLQRGGSVEFPYKNVSLVSFHGIIDIYRPHNFAAVDAAVHLLCGDCLYEDS